MSGAAVKAQTTQNGTLVKLMFFSLALGIVPISTYFFTQTYVFNENSVWAALAAVVAANIILISYVIVAIREESAPEKPLENKKTQ